jgi:hypothetical protein
MKAAVAESSGGSGFGRDASFKISLFTLSGRLDAAAVAVEAYLLRYCESIAAGNVLEESDEATRLEARRRAMVRIQQFTPFE